MGGRGGGTRDEASGVENSRNEVSGLRKLPEARAARPQRRGNLKEAVVVAALFKHYAKEGEQKCWFRTGDAGREAGEGWVSGAKGCHPPGTQVMPMGNMECWAEGFGYNECCDAKYGPNGNAQCWDGVYNYDRCCFPKEEL
ncbi:unnamed protein product [Prorocentrum cordatum]|uniref:Cellulase n=1 Tax=Prorocentrum cordatum TaxID=2364126 RepID=A0ABN9U854_9DINO|nr:unnamed protein product [Polarella glacialis]